MKSALRLAALLLLLTGALPARADELGFALIGTEKTDTLLLLWQPFLEDLSKAIGIEVKAMAFPDYSGAIWALKTRKAGIAWLGNKSAILAVDQAQSEVAFIGVQEGGETGYTAQLITRTDSRFMDADTVLQNASSITFALGDPNSTSGYVVPSYYLFSLNRIDPHTAFKRLVRGTHEENFLAAVHGLVDVATNNSFDLRRMKVKYPELFPLIRVIWNSPIISSDPIVWRQDLSEANKEAIRQFFLHYGAPDKDKRPEILEHEQTVLKGLGRVAFRISDNRQLLPIRRLDLFSLKERIQGDPKLDEKVRQEKLKEITKKIEALTALEKTPAP